MKIEEILELDRKIRNGRSKQEYWKALDVDECMSLVQEVYRLRSLLQTVYSVSGKCDGQ